MENQNQKKSPNKHLIISLSIIGVALVAAVLIAVFAIVANLNNKVNGKNPEELYASISSLVKDTDNYHIRVRKTGSGAVLSGKNVLFDAQIEVEEEARVDGEDFYYSKTLITTRNEERETITTKITVVDGVSYIYILTDGGVAQMTKAEATSRNFEQIDRLIQSIVWDYDDLFEGSKFKASNNLYKIEMNKDNADDPDFAKALSANANMFFTDNVSLLSSGAPKDFEEYDYVITYNDQGRPVSVVYDFLMGNNDFFVGDLSVSAVFDYGTVTIEAPEDAEAYE